MMKDLVDVLHEFKVFYLATESGGKPHVRPFGAVVRYDGRVWFCSHDAKNVCRQMKTNPQIEIAATGPDAVWVRVTGKAVFEDNPGAKNAMFALMPQLRDMYAAQMDHFVVFYLQDATAVLCKIDGTKIEDLQV